MSNQYNFFIKGIYMLTFSFLSSKPEIFLPVLVLFLTGILFLFMAAAAWRYRHTRAAFSFTLLMLAMSCYSLGYFFEINSNSISQVFLWLRFQYLGIAPLPALWLLFVLQYTDRRRWLKFGKITALFIIPLITLSLVFTNDMHNLFYKSMTLLSLDYIAIVTTEKGPGYWIHITYFIITFIMANFFLLEAFLQSRDYFKKRFLLMFISSLFPWAAFMIYIFGYSPMNLDLIPFGMVFTSFIISYDLLPYRLFDILPIARSNVFDAILEGVVVLDSSERIVDLNEASSQIYGFDKAFIGQHVRTLLQLFTEEYRQDSPNTLNTMVCTYDSLGGTKWLEVGTSPLKDQSGEAKGKLLIIRDITQQKQAEKDLRDSEEKYRLFIQNFTGIAYQVDLKNSTLLLFHGTVEEMTGWTEKDFLSGIISWNMIIHEDDLPLIQAEDQKLLKSLKYVSDTEYRINHRDGQVRWVRDLRRTLKGSEESNRVIQGSVYDITVRKEMEEALRESEALQSSIVEAIPDTLIRFNGEGLILDILTLDDDRLSLPYTEGVGKTVGEVMPASLARRFTEGIRDALQTKTLQTLEYDMGTSAGTLDYEARIMAYAENEVVSIIRDITDDKRYQEKLEYLSLHDSLTGLYNRAFFEAEMQRLSHSREYPITIMSADLDGLKLINDTLGHDRGDSLLRSSAKVVKNSLRRSDILARVGGDEFAVILPRTDFETGEEVVRRIQENVNEYNEQSHNLPLSLSVGIATTKQKGPPLEETYKIADDAMYRNKLYGSSGTRNKMIHSLLASLEEKDSFQGVTSMRLAEYCQVLGRRAGLSAHQLAGLALLVKVRDLGKIGIPDHILSKRGRLTSREWDILKQHPEKGYRIASVYPDLSGVADLIHKHHERWDGKGYPLGIEGETIPIECRILAIVEAYHAMVDNTPPVSKEEAAQRIKKQAGSHFDPALVHMFLDILTEDV